MRIVYVTPFYYPVVGGVEEVARRIAEYMASKGHDVYVLTYNRLRVDGKRSLPRKDIINNVEVIRIEPNLIWSHGTYSSEIPRVLEELRPDLVHVHAWRHPHVFQVAKVRKKLKFKAVIHTHAPFHKLNQLGLPTWLYHKAVDQIRKGALREYDAVVALTPYEKNLLVGKLGVKSEKIKIIPNGIDDEISGVNINTVEIDMINENPVILYVGRISRSKNVDLLIKAMRILTKKKMAKLFLAGPDENLIAKLRRYSRKFNIGFHYMGQVSEVEKHKLYSKCTVFAHPAIYEPFGITLLEAQAFGKPCVITGEGGQLYAAPPGMTSLHAMPNPEDFGEKMAALLMNEELYEKFSRNARKWALRHLWSKILPAYYELYDEICG
jgi:glycosyltransferase involved in cell wall biosynthesis